MNLFSGPGRIIKLLLVAVASDRVSASLPPLARFPVVFLAVLLADSLRPRHSGESPLYLEDVVSGILLYAGAGLLCWGFDYALSLYTGRHGGPVLPSLVLALIEGAEKDSKRR